MSLFLTDSFANRTVNSGLGVTSDGTTWQAGYTNGSVSVANNEGRFVSATGTTYNHFYVGNTFANGTIKVRMSSASVSTDTFGLHFRYVDDNNNYMFRLEGGKVNLVLTSGGTGTSLLSKAISTTNSQFYWLEVTLLGTSIQCKYWSDGSSEPTSYTLTTTDGTITSGKVGLYAEPHTNGAILADSLSVSVPFVTRTNSTLYTQGQAFKATGGNCYWLGLAEVDPHTGNGSTHYPSTFEIDDAIQTAVAMSATCLRVHTLGISVGNSYSIARTLSDITGGTPNSAAFNTIDYAIYKAGLLGLKLVIPLVDNYHYYHGGKHTFTDWRSISDETQFYTNSQVISDFETYVSFILNRVNQYNSTAYKNDPTIMCWETGNEIAPPTSWTTTISGYIKSVDPIHLIMDGNYGVNSSALSIANIDIYSNHFYPPNISQLNSDASACGGANKAYFVGEYGWINYVGGTASASIDTTTSAGSATQSLKVVTTSVATNDFYSQVLQAPVSGISLTSGHTYTVKLYAKALSSYTLNVGIQQNHDSYNVYSQQSITPTTSWTQYTWSFTASATDSNVLMFLNYGLGATTTWVTNITVVDNANSGTNLMTDGNFTGSSISPWSVNNKTFDSLSSYLSAIESNANVCGDVYWNLQSHAQDYGFDLHLDGYSVYYPNGTSTDDASRFQTLRTHAYTQQGVSPAPSAGTVNAPIITSIASPTNTIAFSGVPGAKSYDLERSTTQNGTYSLVINLTDTQTPYTDASGTSSSWYRVKAYNISNVAGTYSVVVSAGGSSGSGTGGGGGSGSSGASGTGALVITDAGRRLFRDGTSGANTPVISYVAVGTSTTSPTSADTALGNEVFRKKVSSYTNGTQPGEILITVYLGTNDANGFDIEEVGFFGGASVSSTAGSGVLVAHGLYSLGTKTQNLGAQFQCDFIFS